jgi:hypothetical protein
MLVPNANLSRGLVKCNPNPMWFIVASIGLIISNIRGLVSKRSEFKGRVELKPKKRMNHFNMVNLKSKYDISYHPS